MSQSPDKSPANHIKDRIMPPRVVNLIDADSGTTARILPPWVLTASAFARWSMASRSKRCGPPPVSSRAK